MKRLVHLFITVLFAGIWAMTSCTDDRDRLTPAVPGSDEEGMSEISFLVGIPQTNQVATRSVGSVEENAIKDIYVLVFDAQDKLITKAKGKGFVFSGTNKNQVSFKATLPVGDEYQFMVLANAETQLAGINVGATPAKEKDDVLALVATNTGIWDLNTDVIPMWAEKTMTLTASTKPTFELIRMLARINVDVEKDGNPLNNFKLTSIRYYNYNTNGALAANIDEYNTTGKFMTEPTLPASPGTKIGEALEYGSSYIKEGKSCKDLIYVFEAGHNGSTYYTPEDNSDWINNPCLIIGGQYSPDGGNTFLKETFYRVDFIKKDRTNPNDVKQEWLSVIRNFSYNVVITEVSGSGFEDLDVALKSAPINMESNVLEWNESDMGEIVFDGVFYLSVSQEQFVFERGAVNDEREEYTLYVKTDYIYNSDETDSKSGWKVEKYVDGDDETTEVTWLKLNPENGAPNDRVKAYFTFEENPENVNRRAVVWITAGRLRYPVYITQRILSLYITDPQDGNKQISEIKFEVPRNFAAQEPRKFKVDWTPVNQPVAITWDSPQVWNPFAPEWLDPNPNTMGWSISPGGTQTFEINPPTVSALDISTDPFYEKETTYIFTVESGGEQESKRINIHQIYYNIIVDTYLYRLDGKTYTLSVRSNTDWEIVDIEEWLYNQDPAQNPASAPVLLQLNNYDNLKVGTKGGHNTAGEAVAFTVVNQETEAHKNKWGTVYVTFKNPDDKFNPVRVGLVFPPPSLTILGIGATNIVRAYNVCKASPYHNNSLFNLLSNENNFGNHDDSVVKLERLNIVARNSGGYSSNNPTGTAEDEYNFRKGDLQNWLNEYMPGIIVISYHVIFNEAETRLLMEYMENGGVVIMYYGGDVQSASLVRPFFTTLFGKDLGAATSATQPIYGRSLGSRVYRTENVDDPVLNGPFGDMRGKLWGTQLNTVNLREEDIAEYVHVLSRTSSEQNTTATANSAVSGYVNMFRHKKYNLFWIGNAMGTATYYHYYMYSEPNQDPNFVTDDGTPGVRDGFATAYASSNLRYDVYNSYIFANAIAWAITTTNHAPPVGGYTGYSASDY